MNAGRAIPDAAHDGAAHRAPGHGRMHRTDAIGRLIRRRPPRLLLVGAVQRVEAHVYERPGNTWWHKPGRAAWSVCPRRAAQPPASWVSSPRSTTDAVAHRGECPLQDGGGAAISAASPAGLVINRSSSDRHTGGISGSTPASSHFHGLDDVEGTRARHDAPSQKSVLHPDRATARALSHMPAVSAPQGPPSAQEDLPPCRTERATLILIRDRLRNGPSARGPRRSVRRARRRPLPARAQQEKRNRDRCLSHNLICRDGMSSRPCTIAEVHGLRRSLGRIMRDLRLWECLSPSRTVRTAAV